MVSRNKRTYHPINQLSSPNWTTHSRSTEEEVPNKECTENWCVPILVSLEIELIRPEALLTARPSTLF